MTDLPANQRWTIYPPSRLCDAEGDGSVGPTDFVVFAGCFADGFAPGCEMMDLDGNSSIYSEDLLGCFAGTPSDCNGNGQEDLIELLFDLDLDADSDGVIDCCSGGSTPHPNPVGSTLTLQRLSAGGLQLDWTAPPADATHDAATSYDVYASESPSAGFGLLANVAATSHLEPVGPAGATFYLVNPRNECGTSGEEPF